MLFLESTSYEIGYVIGQIIGVLILVAIPAGIVYVIYRATRKKSDVTSNTPTFPYNLRPAAPEPQGGPCPACGNQAGPHEVFCANCGRPVGEEPIVSCANCGHALPADAQFCANCGTPAPAAGSGDGNGQDDAQTMYQQAEQRSGDSWEG